MKISTKQIAMTAALLAICIVTCGKLMRSCLKQLWLAVGHM